MVAFGHIHVIISLVRTNRVTVYILLVPDAAPVVNGFTFVGTTNFDISWSPPPAISQDGVITEYTIDITGERPVEKSPQPREFAIKPARVAP